MAKLDERIGFIGGGNMAFAIGSGIIRRGIVKSSQILVSGPHSETLTKWRDLGASTSSINGEVISICDIIFLCVKPHQLHACALEIKHAIDSTAVPDKEKLIVSILAGVPLQQLQDNFKFMRRAKFIRIMPNTPMQVSEGCSVYTPDSNVTKCDLDKVTMILNSLGISKLVPEYMIGPIGAIAGCGPAYIYTVIEALADGGVKQGIPRQLALQCAAQTVLGAAKTVIQTGKHPAELRDEVCSPGGSTICGIHELEKAGIRNAFINAVEKAAEKSATLGQQQQHT